MSHATGMLWSLLGEGQPAGGTAATPLTTGGTEQATVGAEELEVAMSTASRTARSIPGTFRTPVRGYPFAAAPPGVAAPGPEQMATLVREPANPADPHAIAVWVEPSDAVPWRIGYLDRFVASRLAPLLDSGQQLTAAIDGWVPEPDERWQRPLLRILEPARASAQRVPRGGPAGDDGNAATPRLWGRPPGVRRRVVAA